MSLINKMLQDLDARGGASAGHGGEPQMRAVPTGTSNPRALMAAGAGAAVLLLAAGGWLGWRYLQHGAAEPGSGPLAAAPQSGMPAAAQAPGQPAVSNALPPSGTGHPASGQSGQTSDPAAADAGHAAELAAQLSEARRKANLAQVEAERLATPPASSQTAARAPAANPASARKNSAAVVAVQSGHEAGAGAAVVSQDGNAGAGTATVSPAAARAAAARADRAEKAERADSARNADVARAQANSGGVTVNSMQQGENSYRRGLASLQDGRVQEAIAHLEQAVFYYPRHDAARQTLVGLLIENKRLDEATRHLQFGLGLDPKQAQMAMLLARLQLEKGGPAIETLQRTLPYAGNNGDYLAFLAGALQRAQRNREAAEQYRAALRIQPQNGVWWMGLGIALQADKRNAEAVDAYTHAKNAGNLSQELQSFVERKLQQLR